MGTMERYQPRMRSIQDICSSIGLTYPRTLIECGAAHPATYRLGHYVNEGRAKVILVEANPRLYYCLTQGFEWGDFQREWPNIVSPPHEYAPVSGPLVRIVHAAVVDEIGTGTIKLYECNASSFVGGTNSPARINDRYIEQDKDAYEVPTITIDRLDDGEVDVLLADVEGSEWFCIKHLISRPRLIVLEMKGQSYVNPHADEIDNWMKENGYQELESDATDVAWRKT